MSDKLVDKLKQLKAFFDYRGADPKYFEKAKAAAGVLSAYAQLRAIEARAIEARSKPGGQ